MTSPPSRLPTSPRARRCRTDVRLPAAVVTLLAAVLMVVFAVPAAAHPFILGGGEIPVDSLATITLDLAHGCGSEGSGTGQDSLEVALEVPEWLRVVEVADHPGYRHDVEVAQGRIVVVTWRADGGPSPAPAFELDVVASGPAGESRHLAVFQACVDSSHRWIGTPDAPADDPAIDVRLVAADPERPAPPAAPIVAADDHAGEEDLAEEPDRDTSSGPQDAAAAAPDDADTGSAGAAADDDPSPTAGVGSAPTSDQGGVVLRVLTWIGAVLAGALAVALLVLVLPGRRGASR